MFHDILPVYHAHHLISGLEHEDDFGSGGLTAILW